MKLTCNKERLIEGVEIVGRVSGKNLTLPVLNHILLDAESSQLVLRSTNLEVGIEVTLNTKVLSPGRIAISGMVLLGTLSSVRGDSVTLEEREGNLLVTTSIGSTLIKALPADDFPSLPKVSEGEVFTVAASALVTSLRSVVFSASTSAIKPEQASIYLYPDRNRLVSVATDSFRLAEKMVEFTHELPDFDPVLVPVKNALEALRLLETQEGEVELRITRSQLSFSCGNIYFTTRLIDGSFPDYRQVIPKTAITEALILRQDLAALFKKAALFSGVTNQVIFRIVPKEKSFTLEARSAEVGEMNDALSATLKGEPLDIHFNYRYVADCLSIIPTDSVSLSFSGLGRPLIIRGVGDATFLYLVMPMNK
jgi:DNA polymerase III subunit beta